MDNSIKDLPTKTRMRLCLQWLQEEHRAGVTATVAARIYHLNPHSVQVALARMKRKEESLSRRLPRKQNGGHNKILDTAQIQAIYQYAKDQADSGLGATKRMLFCTLLTYGVNKSLQSPLPPGAGSKGFLSNQQPSTQLRQNRYQGNEWKFTQRR